MGERGKLKGEKEGEKETERGEREIFVILQTATLGVPFFLD